MTEKKEKSPELKSSLTERLAKSLTFIWVPMLALFFIFTKVKALIITPQLDAR